MKNLTKTFKTFFIAYIVLFLLGVVVSCIFGLNTSATLGNGQQLIYKISSEKDNYDSEIDAVKSFLKENGATMVTEQVAYDAFDKSTAIVFTFKTAEPLSNQVNISGQDCQVFDVDNTQTKKIVGRAAIAIGVALVLVFAYFAIRFVKNNWMAYSVGAVCSVVLNWFAIFGLVQLAGLVGFNFDATIMATFAYAMLFVIIAFLMTTAMAHYYAETRKTTLQEGLNSANKKMGCYYWVVSIIVAVACVALSVVGGTAFAIKLVPIAIASIVSALTATKVAPAFWTAFLKTDEAIK